jgi:hypothetical protein
MLLEEFKTILTNNEVDSRRIVRRHLIHGDPFFFKDNLDSFISLKEEIADKFNLHPHNVLMVGSAKLGFSISPDNNWKIFSDDSDIDMVLVSERAFQSVWKELFLFNSNIARHQREEDNFTKFKNYFFRGWIRPDYFSFNYPGKKDWFEFFSSLTKKYGAGHKIVGALYYNYDFFEKYHINNIDNLRRREIQNG